MVQPVIPATWEAKTGELLVQNQPQQKQGTKQLSETLYLNKIQNSTGDVAQWLSAPESDLRYAPQKISVSSIVQ